ncbi:MAG: phosphate starvation-inducible protein PhoH, partial [Pseudomonadota bacterium]
MSAPDPDAAVNEAAETRDLLLEPADNERLANLCGQLDEHLRQVERGLGVQINNRGNAFRI